MAEQRLGQFYEGFASWRRALARAAPESQPVIFANAVAEVAGFVRAGLDRVVAADELNDMAVSIGFDDADRVQQIIGSTFASIDVVYDEQPTAVDWSKYGDYQDAVTLDRLDDRPQQARKPKANGHDVTVTSIELLLPFPIDVAALPKRPWLVPGLLLRRQVTLLVAPPGIGKSLLTVQLAIMCAAPMTQWGNWQPRQRCRVLMVNSEEDSDELRRRLWAAAEVMQVDPALLAGTLYCAANPDDIVIAKADSRSKTVTRTPMIDNIIRTVREQSIDILVIDPFSETFIGDENSNSELKWAAVLWREVARSTDCAVLLVHHAKKYANEPGDMDAARGGGSLAGVARIVSTLFGMSEADAAVLLPEDEVEERHKYIRFDDAKSNLSLTSHEARWFEKRSIALPSNDDAPPDQVGVLVEWKPVGAFERMTLDQANKILDEIEGGVIDDDGNATGDRFLVWSKGQRPKHWVGDVIQRAIACTAKEAKVILKTWRKNKVLEIFSMTSPRTRHPVDGCVRVNQANRPGGVQRETIK